MQNFSQNQEQEIILNYFGDKVGTLLSIGENDGETLSNSRALILNGWSADLVEPAPLTYKKLNDLYITNDKVSTIECAICDYTGLLSFWVSGEHLGKGDSALLSTLSLADKQKWEHTTTWNEVTVMAFTFTDFMKNRIERKYDFITIDAEGYDYKILEQIDLLDLGCSCICIEHNSVEKQKYIDYLTKFNMRVIYQNAENLIAVV